jgi:hypothetical protein
MRADVALLKEVDRMRLFHRSEARHILLTETPILNPLILRGLARRRYHGSIAATTNNAIATTCTAIVATGITITAAIAIAIPRHRRSHPHERLLLDLSGAAVDAVAHLSCVRLAREGLKNR